METREVRKCSRCGRTYTGKPALSRVDNETPICPLCGTREALELLDISEEEVEIIVGIVETNTEV